MWYISFVYVFEQLPSQINHLIEIDHQGRKVAMDVIHDPKDKTVLAIVGDVSKYKNGIQTVNFHDYNTVCSR